MRKLLALDLDGTTVGDNDLISEANLRALREAKEAGHSIVIVTGRRELENALLVDVCNELADYILYNMGGTLVRTSDHRVLFDTYMDPKSTSELVEYCTNNNLQLHVFGPDFWQVNKWTDALAEYTHRAGAAPTLYDSVSAVETDRVHAGMATQDADAVSKFMRGAGLALDYVDSEPGCIDILPAGLNKWDGISRLLALTGASPDQVLAIGDYDSDVSMLQNAGVGVAVANARPVAKAVADFVTIHDNNEDAVADVVDQLMLGTRTGLLEPAGL